jgi:uncharacterized membrane protein
MRGSRIAIQFSLLLLAFLAIDAVWLGFAGQRLYRPAIGHLMREGFGIAPAIIFYLLYVAGLVFFVTLPARRSRDALLRGALFGLVAYATYDLTNQATLRDWPWLVTLVDLVWGAFVSGTSCAIAHRLTRRN